MIMESHRTLQDSAKKRLTRYVMLALVAVSALFISDAKSLGQRAPFGTGPGAWPVAGALYEVNPEYFPNHSLNEITARIPTLKKLGISALYILPLFQCVGGAQYLILDYYTINPRYGTAEDLTRLVKVAHQNGIKVLLDFVTSLTPEGSYITTKHPEWILRGNDGKMQHYYPFPAWGWALDATNPGLIDYYTKIARYYVAKFDTDGWRVDSPMNNYDPTKVSGDHNRMKLLFSVKTAITVVNKNALLIAEIAGPEIAWGIDDRNAKPLFDEMCEASYNYDICGFLGGDKKSGCTYLMSAGSPGIAPYAPTILDKVVKNEATSSEFVEVLKKERILDNRLRANVDEDHDTARVSECFPLQHRALFSLIATMPGFPVVHAGEEIGSTVHPEANGSETPVVNWAAGDLDLEAFYERVLTTRKNNQALIAGDIRDVWKSGDKAIAFLRSSGDSRVLVILNFDSKPARFTVGLPVSELGLSLKHSYKLRDALTGEVVVRQGKMLENLDLNLPPYGEQIVTITGR
jgi:hypothetical protein